MIQRITGCIVIVLYALVSMVFSNSMKNKFIMSGCKHYMPENVRHRRGSVDHSSMVRVEPKVKPVVYTVNGMRMKFSSSVQGALLSDVIEPNRITILELKNFFMPKADNGRIMITMCDKGYLDIFRLFYRLNRMEQYKNFVVVVLDKAGYDILVEEGYPVFYYKNDLLSVDESSSSTRMWTSSAFSKMVLKLVIIKDLLSIKLRVLYMDSDIRLFKDPFPILRDYESYDMAAQRDDTLCAGFMYIQPTTETVRLFQVSVNEMYRRGIMDQDALSIVVQQSSSFRFVFLPALQFMSGREYSRYHQFFWDKDDIDKDIVMYHNNYIIYEHNKMYRWREQGILTDDNGYYDLSPNGYILVDNINWNLCSRKMKSTPFFEGIKQLAHLVIALNRTLIMPALPCPDSVKANLCTLCAYNDVCANGFQKVIHYNYKAYQVLFDERSPAALRKQFKEGPVYQYQCTKSKKTIVQNNTILLGHRFVDADLDPFKDGEKPLLFHVKNVPNCLKKMRFDVSGYHV